ncbi:helix-turn-helix domain-containing protein [Brevibacillus sp. GCM10020057]|uniref:helix-turn-helix domain-containing protein n=1 Tax=Brevibacillus sp. GCM10020057 TaxID=3317327 RepID=UPI00363D51CC
MSKSRDVVIGKRIRQARVDLSFTQEFVAQNINMTRDRYANIESGRTACLLTDAQLICNFLGLEVEELLKDDDTELEGVILFRSGEDEDGVEEQLLDWSDNIYMELIAQEELYRKHRGGGVSYV